MRVRGDFDRGRRTAPPQGGLAGGARRPAAEGPDTAGASEPAEQELAGSIEGAQRPRPDGSISAGPEEPVTGGSPDTSVAIEPKPEPRLADSDSDQIDGTDAGIPDQPTGEQERSDAFDVERGTDTGPSAAAEEQLREAGYRDIKGVFVDIPVDTSVARAQSRHRRGNEEYRNGQGLGGRYVPEAVIRENTDTQWGSVNRRTFEQVKDRFDAWAIYDNGVDGRAPVLVDSSDEKYEES